MWDSCDAAKAVGVVCTELGLVDWLLVDFEAVLLIAAEALHVDIWWLL